MGNTKKVKKSVQHSEEPVVEKVVSPRRVAIASVLCIVITGIIIWSLSQAAQKLADIAMTPVEKQEAVSTSTTEVRLPKKDDAATVLQEAKKSISEFSIDNYTATGSAARSVIDTLQGLQESEFGIEDYFCEIFCN